MDPALLIDPPFWSGKASVSFDAGPAPQGLEGHVIFSTSGSSGKPKGVALSKTALLASASVVNRHLQVTGKSCWGLALPMRHVGGFGVVARVFEAKCRLAHLKGSWESAGFAEWLARNEVTHTSLVPTQVHDLVQQHLRAPSSLRAIVVGGGRLEQALGQAARDLGWPVLASYGMTETASQIATQALELLDSPYQPAPIPLLPTWQARCEDDGRLAIAGPALFSGYVIDGVFHPRDSEWHVTSDRVQIDGRLLTPLGRADNVVKILGELVDPEAVERELLEISNGALRAGGFAVVAISDERAEHMLVPVFESEEIAAAATTALASYASVAPGFRRLQAPRVMEFPRSELGKLRRGELAMRLGRDRPPGGP